jgi:hypothetical protein
MSRRGALNPPHEEGCALQDGRSSMNPNMIRPGRVRKAPQFYQDVRKVCGDLVLRYLVFFCRCRVMSLSWAFRGLLCLVLSCLVMSCLLLVLFLPCLALSSVVLSCLVFWFISLTCSCVARFPPSPILSCVCRILV